MAKDIDKELDEIKQDHTSRIAEGKQIAAATVVSENAFRQSWQTCLNGVIRPALEEMLTKLTGRGMGSKVQAYGIGGWGIWIEPPAQDRRLHGEDRWPHLGISANVSKRTVTFDRSPSAIVRPTRIEEYAPTDVTPEIVREQVMELVREVYG